MRLRVPIACLRDNLCCPTGVVVVAWTGQQLASFLEARKLCRQVALGSPTNRPHVAANVSRRWRRRRRRQLRPLLLLVGHLLRAGAISPERNASSLCWLLSWFVRVLLL